VISCFGVCIVNQLSRLIILQFINEQAMKSNPPPPPLEPPPKLDRKNIPTPVQQGFPFMRIHDIPPLPHNIVLPSPPATLLFAGDWLPRPDGGPVVDVLGTVAHVLEFAQMRGGVYVGTRRQVPSITAVGWDAASHPLVVFEFAAGENG